MVERKLYQGTLVYVMCRDYKNSRFLVPMIFRNTKSKDIHYKMWVAPGGGLEEGESFRECASRELNEETGILINPSELVKKGRVYFDNKERMFKGSLADFDYECEVYYVETNQFPTRTYGDGKKDLIRLFNQNKVASISRQHPGDRYLWLALQQSKGGKTFDIIIRHLSDEISGVEIQWK
ncbi:MAG: NUDIX domain-containing protein [Nanoarchaeota archaeon]